MVREYLARLWPFPTDDGGAEGVEDGDGDPADDGQVRTWDFIPAWQYDGWQVENGGLSVGEQEAALGEVQRRGEAIEEAADDPADRPDGSE